MRTMRWARERLMEPTLWENTLKEDRRQGGGGHGGTAHVHVRRVTTHPIAPILLRSIDVIFVNRLFLYALFHLLQGLVILVLRSTVNRIRPPSHKQSFHQVG
jgi:hypothetical protein